MAAVSFHVIDQHGADVQGVVIRVYDEDNTYLEDEQSSDAAGLAAFILNPGQWYARFYGEPAGATVESPMVFTVIDPGLNNFGLEVVVFEHPEAPDPRYCTISGFFRDGSGRPQRGLSLHVHTKWSPSVVANPVAGYHPDTMHLSTDDDGYVQFDMLRGAKVDVIFGPIADQLIDCEVPDQASVDVVDWIFPWVASVAYVPAGPLAMAVSDTQNVVPSAVLSNGLLLEVGTDCTPWEGMDFTSSDEDVVTAAVSGTHLTIVAVGAGAATVTATVRDGVFAERLPLPTLLGAALAVVVV
jgi:hypothetical protein